ncbi:MAG: GpE family phage tail protein [endosymbiont of Seepiophila jonesi]|uniref:GpE family phage tail protein n=1 Tax=endosymbiont of Lamellibrachia luymesi TaxID=2200907 RepID=A0A370E0S3_9GAMM|nr:MAG: GpE family phage tail protein [endosymbiont of Lamellibrachia luymesi]RDH92077.1 MAG: GpE family phage tail protein [endosymbiont of Seepiophila jonesi]
MANIAVVFHWPLSEIKALGISDLMDYHRLAIERSKISGAE